VRDRQPATESRGTHGLALDQVPLEVLGVSHDSGAREAGRHLPERFFQGRPGKIRENQPLVDEPGKESRLGSGHQLRVPFSIR
jgi:hypothetical protein